MERPQLAPWGCKTGCRAWYHTLPPVFPAKPSLLSRFFLFLPPYLSTVLWLVCQSSRSMPSLLLARHTSTISAQSLFCLRIPSSCFALCSLRHLNSSSRRLQCRRRSPRKISFSELVRRAQTLTRKSSMALKSRSTSKQRPRRIARGPWVNEMGRFTALGPCAPLKGLHTLNRYA